MKQFSKAGGGVLLSVLLLFAGCGGGGGGNNSAPVVSAELPYTVAAVGDTIVLPEASVEDEETLTATAAVYKGTEKVADVTDGTFTPSSAGDYTVRYTATDSAGQAGTAEISLHIVENVLNTAITATIPAGESMEIRLGSGAINAATGETDGTFSAGDYDFMYSDIANGGTEAVTVGTKLVGASSTTDLTAIEGSLYENMSVSASATKTLRFTGEYLVNKAGVTGDVSQVVYFVENGGDAEKSVTLTVKNFVLGEAETVDSLHFKAAESKEGVKDTYIDLTNLKSVIDVRGETTLDYIRKVKVSGQGEVGASVTEDGKLRLTVDTTAGATTAQWHFFSWDSIVGVPEQGLLKRDLSQAEYLVMVFERDAGVSYGDATICMLLQSDDWGVSWSLPCPYQSYNNMWFANITNQDEENENLVYYYFPLKQQIEDEVIQSDWCANVDSLQIQMAALPTGAEYGITVHGIYWC